MFKSYGPILGGMATIAFVYLALTYSSNVSKELSSGVQGYSKMVKVFQGR